MLAMKLFNLSNKDQSPSDQPSINVELVQQKSDLFLRTTLALLHFMKAFAQDIQDIHADTYKETIDLLTEKYKSSEKPPSIELVFEREKINILSFIERQNQYLEDREKELRDIIDLLTKAMANLSVENRDFYQRVYDQSEKMIEITRLDDIKKIKAALKHEVDQMREVVDCKRDQELRQMKFLAGQVSSLRDELEKAKEKSITDGLTGVYNRLALDEYLAEKIERSEVMKDGFALLMLDLDNFKSINDKFGHPIGDRVLVAIAKKCRTAIRSDDFLARYGGEEFAIILPGANLKNALKKAEQICQLIAATRYAASSNQSEEQLSVTVSIGVSAFKKGDTPASLIARADEALYNAKRRGKNKAIAGK
jgi:diguanylate cyclase